MTEARQVQVGELSIANDRPFTLIAGPCQIESRQHAHDMAGALKEASAAAGIELIYKSSYDKANRTSLSGQRGIGLEEGIEILAEVRESARLPGADRRARGRSTAPRSARRSTCCRSRPSSAARPTSWWRRPRPAGRST